MNNVMQQLDQLIDAIHVSNEYTQYQMLDRSIAKDEQVYNRLNEYRRRNFEIQMNQNIDIMEACVNLNKEYEDVLNRSEVKEYLSAERRYIKMIRKITQKIDNQIDINIDFL